MSVNSREISLYKFGDDDNYGYFDINGKSVEKALMKTPINGSKIIFFFFGMRKHPIQGFNKMHTGTDFAAPMGTPIMAFGYWNYYSSQMVWWWWKLYKDKTQFYLYENNICSHVKFCQRYEGWKKS